MWLLLFPSPARRGLQMDEVGISEPSYLAAKLPSIAAEATSKDMRMRDLSEVSGGKTARFPVLLFFGIPRGRASESPRRFASGWAWFRDPDAAPADGDSATGDPTAFGCVQVMPHKVFQGENVPCSRRSSCLPSMLELARPERAGLVCMGLDPRTG